MTKTDTNPFRLLVEFLSPLSRSGFNSQSTIMTLNTRFPPPRLAYPVYASSKGQDISNNSEIDIDTLPRFPQKSDPDSSPSGCTYDSDRLSFSPSVWDDFRCIDTGNAGVRFVRPTTHHIPAWPSLELAASMPLACIFSPFAKLCQDEDSVPVINPESHNSCGLTRCSRCQAFVNPFFRWLDEGNSFECNICKSICKVPPDYYCPINVSGIRRDKYVRPELRRGSVDFLLPDISSSAPPILVFVIDSSYTTCNFFSQVLLTLKTYLRSIPIETEIALVFSDKTITLARFGGNEPSLVVVGDLDDPFVPDIPSNFFVSPHLVADQIEFLIDHLVSRPQDVASIGCKNCINTALVLALELIGEDRAGSILLFQANPSTTPLPSNLFDTCMQSKVCLDIFSWLGTPENDIAKLATRLGGEIHLIDNDSYKLDESMGVYFGVEKMYNVVVKVRCTLGLAIEPIDACGVSLTSGDRGVHFVTPRMTSKSILSVKINVTENLEQTVPVYLQFACMYTREDGTRLTRIHNVVLMPVGHVSSSFKFADAEAIAIYMARKSVSELLKSSNSRRTNSVIREYAIETLVSLLCAYRTHCASRSGSGQLVLPDSLKTLPLLVLGMLKLRGIRRLENGRPLEKFGEIYRLLGWSMFETIATFVPRLHCVYPGPIPSLVPTTRVKVIPSRIYCFETANGVEFYIGREVQPDVVRELFGDMVANNGIRPKESEILKVDMKSVKDSGRPWVCNSKALVGKYAKLTQSENVTVQCLLGGSVAGESKVSSSLLIEDPIDGECCYMDWLCLIHKHIQEHVEY